MSDISNDKRDKVTAALILLSEALTNHNYSVSVIELLDYIEGQFIDEEDAGTIKKSWG